MTEEAPMQPPSRKGEIRKQLHDMIMNEVEKNNLTALIARATALLGNTPDAFNQVWHLPTTKEKLTTLDWIGLVAKELNKEPKIQPVPTWMLHIPGLFIPIMKEFPEMVYQYEQDYIFDSSKFEKRFGVAATKPEDGDRVLVENLKDQSTF